jgi:DNA-binding NarL/FixJ family response regulator
MSDGRPRIRVLMADDHQIFRAGLRRLLESEPDFEVVGEAGDGEEAVRLSKQLKPDVLLLDVSMPRMTGLEALRELEGEVKTILLTASLANSEIVTALQVGARGIVRKESATQVLFKSIRCVQNGEYWVERESVRDLVQTLRQLVTQSEAAAKQARFNLTAREMEILSAVVAGCSNKEIAKQFKLSENTVKHHVSNIFDKMGVSTRVELALAAMHHGLVSDR